MKIAHAARIAPNLSGMYESAREIALAELAIGLDARMVDPVTPKTGDDRGVPIASTDFFQECDVIVSHSGFANEYPHVDKPIIHVLHGNAAYCMAIELARIIDAYTLYFKIALDPRYKFFVGFYPEHTPYWQPIFGDRLKFVAPPVNLDYWSPGERSYDFGGYKAGINVVCSSSWRQDLDPFHILHAFKIFAQRHPDARIHLYGLKKNHTAIGSLMRLLPVGEAKGTVDNLRDIYRAADMVIVPQRMASRTVRETLACGCQLVMGGSEFTPYHANPEDLEAYADAMERAWDEWSHARVERQNANQEIARTHFNPTDTAQGMLQLFQSL